MSKGKCVRALCGCGSRAVMIRNNEGVCERCHKIEAKATWRRKDIERTDSRKWVR